MKKSNSSTKQVVNDGNKSYYIFARGITIFPIYRDGKFQIQANLNGNILKLFDKKITQKEINDALAKTVNYYYDILKKEELKKNQNEKNAMLNRNS